MAITEDKLHPDIISNSYSTSGYPSYRPFTVSGTTSDPALYEGGAIKRMDNFISASSFYLYKFRMSLHRVGTINDAVVTFKLYTGPDVNSLTLIKTIGSKSGSLIAASWIVHEFTLDEPFFIEGGVLHWLEISLSDTTGTNSSNYVKIKTVSDPGDQNWSYYFANGEWTLYNNYSFSGAGTGSENNIEFVGVYSTGSAGKLVKTDSNGKIDRSLLVDSWSTSIQVAAAGGATNYTASSRDEIFTDTLTNSDTMTITLPSSPVIGNRVKIIDGKNDWSANNVTIDRNGSNIDGLSSDFTLNVGGSWIEFIYMDATEGWRTIT